MRFVHMADIHLDSPFTLLATKGDLANKRRLEQREVFKKSIEYIKNNKIPFLFISGDLYENEYIRESTIEFVNNLFKQIPETKIFITPGNHDPNLTNSFYNNFCWNENVIIFDENIKKIELEEADIYGYGFNDFYFTNSKINEINIENKNKINILITHSALDASKTLDMQYNPIKSTELKNIGFDYVALGHIHKANYKENQNKFIYPGSLISFGFDELGEHGFLDVEINKEKTNINFIKIEDEVFIEEELNISNIFSEEELIEEINKINLADNCFYKIILTGTKNVEINLNKIINLISHKNILKIKDKTEENINLEKLSLEKNLKGIFTKKMLKKIEENSEEKEDIEEALLIGLKLF